jgi:hypothetical protein
MPDIPRVGDLQVHQDLRHSAREFIVERVGWCAFGLILVAALLGLLGPGLLSRAIAEQGELRVEYDRFIRHQAPTEIRVHARPQDDGKIHLRINREYLERMDLTSVQPPPASVQGGPSEHTFIVDWPDRSRPATLTLRVEARAYGLVPIQIGAAEGRPVRGWQIVYP